MNFSSLNVDVLLHLMKFVHPRDRFNLALSGILKGFENVNKGISYHERILYCGAELGLRRDNMCELEIRSLNIKMPVQPDESLLKILERLADEGYLQNNHKLDMVWPETEFDSRIVELICSMKNLENLDLSNHVLLPHVLAHILQSCSKITDLRLHMADFDCEVGEIFTMDELLKSQLRPAFQRLQYFHIQCYIVEDTCLGFQEMLTWLKECVHLSILNESDHEFSMPLDDSLMLDKNLAESLQTLDFLVNVPTALVKWILSVSLNVHSLRLGIKAEKLNSLLIELGCLKKLKKLTVWGDSSSAVIEIVRSCRQVEILRMNATCLAPSDLAKLEPAENKTDITLSWYNGPCMGEVLPVLKRCRQLRRLKLDNSDSRDNIFPPSEVLSDFIMAMNDLSYLHIVPHHYDPSNYGKLKNLRDQVNQLILPRRPNFKFDISSSDYYGYCHDASLERQLQKNPMVV